MDPTLPVEPVTARAPEVETEITVEPPPPPPAEAEPPLPVAPQPAAETPQPIPAIEEPPPTLEPRPATEEPAPEPLRASDSEPTPPPPPPSPAPVPSPPDSSPSPSSPPQAEATTPLPAGPAAAAEPARAFTTVELGVTDPDVTDEAWERFAQLATRLTGFDPRNLPINPDKPNEDRLEKQPKRRPPQPEDAMTVREIQQGLKDIGIFPDGVVDGIVGYRTRSAIRLFQEYVRTVERDKVKTEKFVPDGRFGPVTQGHLKRWLASRQKVEWRKGTGDHAAWIDFLEKWRRARLASPGPVLEAVTAYHDKVARSATGGRKPLPGTSTRMPKDWSFDPERIHLIGIRRTEYFKQFDDVFILLVRGMVFKFQGTTDPGAVAKTATSAPYLVEGQHAYAFHWHNAQHLALKPMRGGGSEGVLVIRSGANGRLDLDDLAGGLEPNASINIHWGSGKDLKGEIGRWSEGCQSIHGRFYMTPDGELRDCVDFAARGHQMVNPKAETPMTRGAYSVILDLVTALSGAQSSNPVLYSLINEADLDLAPALRAEVKRARDLVISRLGELA
jgi:hypothetical protein